jgi:hypothetical protein
MIDGNRSFNRRWMIGIMALLMHSLFTFVRLQPVIQIVLPFRMCSKYAMVGVVAYVY